VIWSLVWE